MTMDSFAWVKPNDRQMNPKREVKKINECEEDLKRGIGRISRLIVDNAACVCQVIFFFKKKTDPGIKRSKKEKTKKKGRENKRAVRRLRSNFRKTCVFLASLPRQP